MTANSLPVETVTIERWPAMQIARADIGALSTLLDTRRAAGDVLPWDTNELYAVWSERNPDAPEPRDPFDGGRYGYRTRDDHYQLWSSGPDGESRTSDDVLVDSRVTRR